MSKEFFAYSNEGLKFKFIFEVRNDNEIVVTATQQNKILSLPVVYRSSFTKEKLCNFDATISAFKDTNAFLEEIVSSFNSNKFTFTLKNSEIILHFFLLQKTPASLSVSLLKNNNDQSINFISSKLSSFIEASKKHKELIKKISNNFFKNKNVIELLHKENSELKKKSDFCCLVKQQQNLIIQKLSSIQNSIKENRNRIILDDISKQIKLNNDNIENLLKNYSSSILLRPKTKFHLSRVIKCDCVVKALCFLKDGRLVSGGRDEYNDNSKIVVYNEDTYQPDIIIQRAHDNEWIISICNLKNGNFASYGRDNNIKIWEIKRNKFQNICIIKAHTELINKVIELEDGKLCSCSSDKTIKIWDDKNNYKCIQTLTGHYNDISTILEMNNYIISAGSLDGLRVWNKLTYQCNSVIEDIHCYSRNALAKLKDNTLILGRWGKIFIIDTLSFQSKFFLNVELHHIWSICVLRNGKVLIGDDQGMITCFDSLSYQFMSTQKLHGDGVSCIINTKDGQIISSSYDKAINIYD